MSDNFLLKIPKFRVGTLKYMTFRSCVFPVLTWNFRCSILFLLIKMFNTFVLDWIIKQKYWWKRIWRWINTWDKDKPHMRKKTNLVMGSNGWCFSKNIHVTKKRTVTCIKLLNRLKGPPCKFIKVPKRAFHSIMVTVEFHRLLFQLLTQMAN